MRTSVLAAAVTLLTLALGLNSASAQAQNWLASNKTFTSSTKASGSKELERTASKVITGHVVSPTGILPGAVVAVMGTQLSTVTNAQGEFSLTLPANAGPVQLLVSYAGFADEKVAFSPTEQSATLKLATPQVIKVARRQQMKAYSKTANRQVKRTLRKL